MVNDGECPFMFDGTLSFDRVLMPASQASTAFGRPPPSTAHAVPLPLQAGGGKILGNVVPLPPQAQCYLVKEQAEEDQQN